MTGKHPRKGDIYKDIFGLAEIVDERDAPLSLRVKYGSDDEDWYPPSYFENDTLVSYMPNPNDPQPGDRFQMDDRTKYTIIDPLNGMGQVTLRLDSGGQTSWLRSHVAEDIPLRTSVQPEPVNQRGPAAELVVTDEEPPTVIAVDEKLTTTGWSEDKYVVVRYVGTTAFVGDVYHHGSDVVEPGVTFDYHSALCAWRPWTEPVVNTATPAPVVGEWLVTTELRGLSLDDVDETYIMAQPPACRKPLAFANTGMDDGSHVGLVRHVVTKIEQLPEPRIKTVWRVPKAGDKYIVNGGILTAVGDHTENYRQVLVVE